MARIRLWNDGRKTADYRFTDRTIREFFDISGTALFVHLYQGSYGQDGKPDKDITEIQDVVWGENRDRKYSSDVFELRGTYSLADQDFDLKQFGLFLSGDTIFIEIHYNSTVELIGRKLMSGDVIELPHRRDDTLLDEGKAINKYYVVEEVTFATSGWGSTWLPHILRVKVGPMTNAQEYGDILDQANRDPFGLETGDTLRDLVSNLSKAMDQNEETVAEAIENVKARNFETRQFYMVPGDESTSDNPWVFAGDGVPPNGAALLGSGNSYPEDVPDGTYFLRVDYSPATLFKKIGSVWKMQEVDYRRGQWSACSRILEDFLANTDTTILDDGTSFAARQALSQAFKPTSDF